MHAENRRKNVRTGTNPGSAFACTRKVRGGFTMIELGVAVLIFTLIAGVATLAVARSQLSSAKDRFQRSADAELATMLATVATGAYDNLVAGNFLRPAPCVEAPHLSCPEVHGRTLTVTWSVDGVADPTGQSTENLAGVLVTAETTLPFGDVLTRERFVAAGNAGSEGTTLVRVSLTGETYTGPLYLMTAADEVAGSAIVDDMLAVMRSETASCTDTAPCQLALRPDGTGREGQITLDHLAVTGEGIVLDEESVTETGVVLRSVREVHVLLLAENGDGRRQWASEPGSVCLYLSVPTPTGTIEEPACNTESPERVVWRTYRPDPVGRPDVRIALPTDTPMAVLTDPSEGTCTANGQTGWSSGTWAAAAVCTGWTWGTFGELREGLSGSGTPNTSGIVLDGDVATDAHYTAVWTAGSGAPAAGHADGALWEKPRDVPACASSNTCTAPTTSPDTSCPTGYCNSSRPTAPILLEPRRGTYKVPGVAILAGETNTFNVILTDTEGDEITASVSESVGGLAFDGESVIDGDVVADGESGPIVLGFEFEPAPGFTSDTFEISMSDGVTTRSVTIILTATAASPHMLIAEPVEITQNASTATRLLVIDDAGELATGATFTYTGPVGVSLGTPAEIGGGAYAALVAAAATPVGAATYTVSSGSVSDTAPILVTGRAQSVIVDDHSAQQGSSGSLVASVTDVSGNPLEGAHVWFELAGDAAGTVPLGSYPGERGCLTGADGSCSVPLTVEQNAVTGEFDVTARSDEAIDTGTLTITASIAKIVSDGVEIEQGESVAITFTAYTGRNEPATDIPFTASTAGAGVSVTPSGTTGADGTATLTVDTGTNTPVGELVITVDDGANEHVIRAEVLSTVISVDTPATVDVAQYGNASVTVTARNGQGVIVPNVTLTLTPGTGIYTPASVMTGANGTATIALTVGTTTELGEKIISITYDSRTVGTVTLDVTNGVANLTTASTLLAGTTRTVRLTATDNDGELIGGRDLTLASKDTRITIATATVRTNLLGYADFSVTTGIVPAGSYEFTVTVDGRIIPLTLQVGS
jgi:type II secretory pathway pseudopilin PulG